MEVGDRRVRAFVLGYEEGELFFFFTAGSMNSQKVVESTTGGTTSGFGLFKMKVLPWYISARPLPVLLVKGFGR